MNDRKFQKRMIFLINKLCDQAKSEPHNPDAYNKVLIEVREIDAKFDRSRCRVPWFCWCFTLLLLFLLFWLIVSISC